ADIADLDAARIDVELGVAADDVGDIVGDAVELTAIDRVAAGRADLARGHIDDLQAARIDAAGGDTRPVLDHQTVLRHRHIADSKAIPGQRHIVPDLDAVIVHDRLAGGDA